MAPKVKNAISKRRPRQNIIAMILKNAKKQGGAASGSAASTSATSVTTASSHRSHSGGGSAYHGNKRGILKSAVELTRRSKRAGAGGRGKGSKRTVFVKGQRAFYRSAKGISKVTVVGIHHDAKLEPYYTIKLRDGKEKQTDAKHLTPIQEDVKEKESRAGSGKGSAKEAKSGGGAAKSRGVTGSTNSADIMTDPMSDSDGEEEVIDYTNQEEDGAPRQRPERRGSSAFKRTEDVGEVVIDYCQDEDERLRNRRGQRGSASASRTVAVDDGDTSSDDDGGETKIFVVGQDAYYRTDGRVAKVRVLSRGEGRPNRYAVSLSDGSRENVRASQLATLMDLTSKELSMLMKERNRRQQQRDQGHVEESQGRINSKGRHNPRSQPHSSSAPASAADDGEPAVEDEGYVAEESEPQSSGSEPSLSPGTEASPVSALGGSKEQKDGEILDLPSAVEMVEAKTEEGGTKLVPLYSAGMNVYYKNAAGIQAAEILDVHLDDLLEPYYSIKLEDGREKQTDNAHIMMTKHEVEDAKEEGDGGCECEVQEEQGDGSADNEDYLQHEETRKHRCRRSLKQMVEEQLDQIPSEDPAEDIHGKKHQDPDTTDRRDAPETSAQVDSRHDPLPASPAPVTLTLPAAYSLGDEVLYTSSAGDQLRSVVVRLQRDKKNRPYYVVRMPQGKEKQVYGHRLRPYVDPDKPRRSRSRSRAGTRGGRGRSISKSSRVGTREMSLRRSESNDSRKSACKSVLSNSSRRSMASRERHNLRDESVTSSAARDYDRRHRRRGRDDSLASERNYVDPAARETRRNRSPSATRSEKRGARSLGQSVVRRSKSIANSGSDHHGRQPRGRRDRSRSRAPSEDSDRHRGQHSNSASGRGRGRPTALSVSMSSKASVGGEDMDHSISGGDDNRSTARSISKLRNFRKSLAGIRKYGG